MMNNLFKIFFCMIFNNEIDLHLQNVFAFAVLFVQIWLYIIDKYCCILGEHAVFVRLNIVFTSLAQDIACGGVIY